MMSDISSSNLQNTGSIIYLLTWHKENGFFISTSLLLFDVNMFDS